MIQVNSKPLELGMHKADLTLKQFMRKLGISEPTARRWLKTGKIPGAYRLGGQWRIRLDSSALTH